MKIAAPALAMALLLAGCGGPETKDGVSAKQRSDLDNAAALVEGNQVFDTSADSLVLEDDGEAAAAENGAVPAPAPANAAVGSGL